MCVCIYFQCASRLEGQRIEQKKKKHQERIEPRTRRQELPPSDLGQHEQGGNSETSISYETYDLIGRCSDWGDFHITYSIYMSYSIFHAHCIDHNLVHNHTCSSRRKPQRIVYLCSGILTALVRPECPAHWQQPLPTPTTRSTEEEEQEEEKLPQRLCHVSDKVSITEVTELSQS